MCVSSTPGGLKEKVAQMKRQHFHCDLWFFLTLQNWILDFGRPIVMVRRLNAGFTSSIPHAVLNSAKYDTMGGYTPLTGAINTK